MRICWFARLREPDCVPSGPPAYDGLIVGWTGYTNIPTRVRRVAFLKARAREPCRNRPLKFVSCAAQWLPRRGSCLPDGQLFRFFSPGRRERLGGWGIVSAMPGTRIHLRAMSVKTELHVAGFQVVHCSIECRLRPPLALQSGFLVDIICETPRPSTV